MTLCVRIGKIDARALSEMSGQPFSNPLTYLLGQRNADVLQRRAAYTEGQRGR